LAALVASFGCTDGREGARVPESGTSLGAPRVPWRDKTHEERAAFMGAHVEPEMRKLFIAHDPKGYANFGCTTCHGADADLIDFKMPNDIYPLPAEDPVAEAMEYDAKVAAFMMSKVVPTMARLLSEPPGKPEGVTCFTCHPKE